VLVEGPGKGKDIIGTAGEVIMGGEMMVCGGCLLRRGYRERQAPIKPEEGEVH